MAKRWSKTEIAHLKRHAGERSLDELARRLHTDPDTVLRKLEELGLATDASASGASDPSLARYEEGLGALHAKRWQEAAEHFAAVVAEADTRQLADRAQQHLAICRRRLDTPGAAEDPFVEAVFHKNAGDLAAARRLCEKHGGAEDERFLYLTASIQALSGKEDEALQSLERAIRLEPRNRVYAYHDPDFEPLRGRDEFRYLLSRG